MTDKKQPGAKGKRKPSPITATVTYHGKPSGAAIAAALYEVLILKQGKG